MNIDTFAAHGWDASNMIVNAIRKVGEDPAKIQVEVQNLKNYPGVDGVFNYSAKDHAGLKVDALVMVQVSNGQWVEAKP
jgi:branched-chain amino acid transport system substrate-binding protein